MYENIRINLFCSCYFERNGLRLFFALSYLILKLIEKELFTFIRAQIPA